MTEMPLAEFIRSEYERGRLEGVAAERERCVDGLKYLSKTLSADLDEAILEIARVTIVACIEGIEGGSFAEEDDAQ